MINLCHITKDRKSLQQILQIFMFIVDRLRKLRMKNKMATKCPSRKLQMITFNIQPKHFYVNSIHI
jgi:tRNA A37 threonylcarbamoyladenosine dehydratase